MHPEHSELWKVGLGLVACGIVSALAFQRHFSVGRNYAYRRINWMVVCLAFVTLAVVLLVHLVNLVGFETGRR